MANIWVSRSFNIPATVIKSSEQGAFYATKIRDYKSPRDVWRATNNAGTVGTDNGGTWIGYNFGAATPLAGFFFDNINVASFALQYSSNGTVWTSYATVSVSKCRESSRYKVWVPVSGWNYQYARARSATATTTDGSGVLSLGSMVPLSAIDRTWTVNPADPLSRAMVIQKERGQRPGRSITTGGKYAQIILSSSDMPDSMDDEIFDLADYGADPFLLYLNRGATEEAYIVELADSRVKLDHIEPGHIQMNGVVLEEMC